MLVRRDERGWLAIGQPAHAWLSGQLARAWGNERFGEVYPREEVCLAAEQHDVGWGSRDLEPLLHPDEGRPRSFMEMPLDGHLEIFTRGPRRMISQSRYAALLVSMHGWRLYARRDLNRAQPAEADAIRGFLDGQQVLQQELLQALRDDPATAASARDAVVKRNSLLIWTWDYLSLALCLNWDPSTAAGAPTAGGQVNLVLRRGAAPYTWHLDPWPFSASQVTVRCEGRRLGHGVDSQSSLREAFSNAAWETLDFTVLPEPSAERH
jgi:hypothetical protein